ncbi:MAG: hypothetical protein Q4C57_03345 [Bacillota bacterium]|nr:hypothetical protein [Bacillota bacterium]
MYERKILPFYMTYPLPMYYQEEDSIIRDLEYLQQMYPSEAKRYQKIIAGILDKLDYEGSMIYDEYPDKLQLYKLSNDILERIRREEEKEHPDQDVSPEKWEWLGDLIQILLFYEIYKRRHNSRRGILRF